MYHLKFIRNNEIRKESFPSSEEAIQHFVRHAKNKEYQKIILIGPDRKVEKLLRYCDGSPQIFSLFDDVLFGLEGYTIVGLRPSCDEALIADLDIHSPTSRFWVPLDSLIAIK